MCFTQERATGGFLLRWGSRAGRLHRARAAHGLCNAATPPPALCCVRFPLNIREHQLHYLHYTGKSISYHHTPTGSITDMFVGELLPGHMVGSLEWHMVVTLEWRRV